MEFIKPHISMNRADMVHTRIYLQKARVDKINIVESQIRTKSQVQESQIRTTSQVQESQIRTTSQVQDKKRVPHRNLIAHSNKKFSLRITPVV